MTAIPHKIARATAAQDSLTLSQDLQHALAAAAADEETGARAIGRSIALLRDAGLLMDSGATDPVQTARNLMRIGAANLSVGRLWEGHVNALRLIDLYATFAVKSDLRRQIAEGAFLGVWGADGKVPVTLSGDRLAGGKFFASGLGTVTHALVTVDSGPRVRLALIDVTDPSRADALPWNMQGMRATASGSHDFTDLPVDDFVWIGAPGDYLQEPHFVGGVWRIAALQAGATIGLLDRAAAQLRALGRAGSEAQKARLMGVLMRAWAGIALVKQAALSSVSRDCPKEKIVGHSIAARLLTEEVGLDAIRAVEQSIGLQHFAAGSETGLMARDLAVYLRQAARDAFLQRAADVALCEAGNIWGVFE